MEPEYGTPKYKEQVDRILTALTGSGVTEDKQIDGIMLLYAMDMSYSRAAICEAEKRYRREVLAKQPPRAR